MSSATMESTISSESCLIFCAEAIAARRPDTTTVSSDCGLSAAGAAGAFWAIAGTAIQAKAWTAARDKVVRLKVCLILIAPLGGKRAFRAS